MQKNKFAYTAPEAIYPAYVSLNERDGFYYLSVRGVRKINGDAGDTIEVPIPRAELRKLSDALRDDRAIAGSQIVPRPIDTYTVADGKQHPIVEL